ncbi:outer membrane protein [Cerasicoccus frondis]|uniref:outer membrane protein n=1 Tax=Cerasicoccus frondis TaxID=490090 RepID=UPI00285253DC|nr:outer membrane beta-barrel protein [Cerasicoccus frondis]
MIKRLSLLSLCLGACTLSLHADNWIGGLEVGYVEETFDTTLSGPGGSFNFVNRARGVELGALGGYEFDVLDNFSIAALARGTWNSAEWNYSLASEPATFRYAMPYTLGIGVQPRVEIAEPISLFAELGAQWGYIQQRKFGPLTDGYDVSDWRPGFVLGAGVEFDIDDNFSLRFNYRHVWYEAYDFQSVTPLGAPVWNVNDKPETNHISLSVIYRF